MRFSAIGARTTQTLAWPATKKVKTNIRATQADVDAIYADLEERLKPPPTPSGGVLLRPGDDVQRAYDDAQPGTNSAVLLFIPRETYVLNGPLTLKSKAGLVTLTSAEALPERRLVAEDAMFLPTLTSGTEEATIRGENGASNIKVDGIRFVSRPSGDGEILVFQDAKNIALDRLLIVAGVGGQKRAIRGNGQIVSLQRSHIANIWRSGQDSQCFCAWDGAGPFWVINNYLEAASENVMFGGADNPDPSHIPSDIIVTDNYFSKRRAEWAPNMGYAVKNLLEFKVGKRVLVARNLFENAWVDAQVGFAILLKSINQDGGSPWNVLEDVIVEDNIIRNVDNGINIKGYDSDRTSGQSTRLTIRRNQLTTSGMAFQITGEAGEVSFTDNRISQGFNLLTLDSGFIKPITGDRLALWAVQKLVFTGNSYRDVPYGIKGSGAGSGEPSLQAFCKEYVYYGNVVA